MAHKYICDGCGTMKDNMDEFEAVGHVTKAIYCPPCLPKAQEYLESVDRLHERTAKSFTKGLKSIRRIHSKNLSALPDTGVS